ncbi:hypothetical protein B0T21DRAFT_418340 [Apiosordaria backusii]|uniref:Glycan binding protein Y3-like domain-containing protein n=1 Tax=Apiosordaria backusii TaxID=314023 RepID=A0AA40EXX3_9PEZI|nr:hypothetical protein B0T21DRAFT_418340 [Apiosordaria backusii]
MKLTTLLTLTASATLASAGCFTGGPHLGRRQNKRHQPHTKSWCYHLTADKRVDFSIRNFQSVGDTLSYDNCVLLLREISGCEHGGKRAYAKFEFTADPNQGRCAVRGPLPPNWPWAGW